MTIDEQSMLTKKERDTVFNKIYWSGRVGADVALEFAVNNKEDMKKL